MRCFQSPMAVDDRLGKEGHTYYSPHCTISIGPVATAHCTCVPLSFSSTVAMTRRTQSVSKSSLAFALCLFLITARPLCFIPSYIHTLQAGTRRPVSSSPHAPTNWYGPFNPGGAMALSQGSQMPRHLISDAHEWINEIPTVPIYYLAKPQPRERAWQNQRGKKTLLSLTLV
jgi:hypothetical protein